jgi:Zn-dependent protease
MSDPAAAASASVFAPDHSQCAFCRDTIAAAFYRVAGRACCSRCAQQVRAALDRNRFSAPAFARAAIAGGLAAMLGAIAWTGISVSTSSEWGILAALIGWFVAKAVQLASGGRRGTVMQTLSATLAVAGVLAGKVLFTGVSYYVIASRELPAPPTLQAVSGFVLHLLQNDPGVLFGGFGIIWGVFAVWIAWAQVRPLRVDFTGPYSSGGTLVTGEATLPHPDRLSARYAATAAEPGRTSSSGQPLNEALSVAILKTVVSMIISIAIYWWFANWQFAVGLVGLILIHEMGHVIANVYYGLRAGPPIFIPFLGAVINLRQMPPDAKVEAIIGIAGPVLGSIGALGCYLWYLQSGNTTILIMAHFGFFLNLFNLLPVPPLDGGRVTAAISPWIWMLGLLLMGLMIFNSFRSGRDVTLLILVLVFALPRILLTLRRGGRSGPYYDISRAASFSIGAAYLSLLGLLAGAYFMTGQALPEWMQL